MTEAYVPMHAYLSTLRSLQYLLYMSVGKLDLTQALVHCSAVAWQSEVSEVSGLAHSMACSLGSWIQASPLTV